MLELGPKLHGLRVSEPAGRRNGQMSVTGGLIRCVTPRTTRLDVIAACRTPMSTENLVCHPRLDRTLLVASARQLT
jgi:hypothetical protein